MLDVQIPGKIVQAFFDPLTGEWRWSRYKVLRGGRGGAKSDTFARLAIQRMRSETMRVLCTRRFQNSIGDSVHRTLIDAARDLGVADEFAIQRQTIFHKQTGSDAVFKGTARSMGEIKSMKGIKICWVEEAEPVPKEDWQILDPTIREPDSEIWISYNPDLENGATHQMFTVRPPASDCIGLDVNWRDNPWFPPVLNNLRLASKRVADTGDMQAKAAHDWIWEGKCRRVTDAIVFRERWSVEDFDVPWNVGRRYRGADWGFADDPTVIIDSFIDEATNTLYIVNESFGYHVEIDQIGARIFDNIEDVRSWPIKGDAAQPAIISYLERQGYPISAAEKWPGSVEDGIAHLKGFARIVIHPRCVHTIEEFKLYSWKTDPRTLDASGNPVILPILIDRYNHGIDSLRYSLDGYIQSRGEYAVWGKLAAQ